MPKQRESSNFKRSVRDRFLELALEANVSPEELGTISMVDFVKRLEQARHDREEHEQARRLRDDPSDDGSFSPA